MNRLRTVIIVGAIVVSIAAVSRLVTLRTAAASFTGRPGGGTAAVETTVVDRGDIPIAITTTGNIQAQQSASLAFATGSGGSGSGKVTAINVFPGDYVRKGQTLASVENQDALDSLALAQAKLVAQQDALNKLTAKPRQTDIDVAQANINLAQVNLNDSQHSGPSSTQLQGAQNSVEVAKNNLWQAQLKRDADNAAKQAASGSTTKPSDSAGDDRAISSATYGVQIAQDQLNSAQSKGSAAGSIASAQAALTSAQANLQTLMAGANPDDIKTAQFNLAAAQQALDQAKQSLAKTTLVAPFDALVASVNINVGEQPPATADIVLLDVSNFYVDLPVAELDIAKIKVDQAVDLTFDALPNVTVPGKVTQVADIPNTGTPVTYNVRVAFDPAGHPLLSTMSTTASIITSNATNVIRLPNRFIRVDRTTNKAYARVQQPDGTFQEVELQLGTANDTYTEIKSGLNVGDVVASAQAVGTGSGAAGGRPGGGFGGGGFFRGGGG